MIKTTHDVVYISSLRIHLTIQ